MTASGTRNIDLDTALADAEARYVAANPQSKLHYERAAKTLPGGNTRTGMHFAPFPFIVEKAKGATVWDVDGHAYRDFVGDFSAGLFGHSHPVIIEAIQRAMEHGMSLGTASVWEAELAQLVCDRVPSIERVRFCNSGTEANTFALLTARAITGRDGILVFEGGYHGGSLSFPPGGNALNLPFPTTIGTYNDAASARTLIEQHKDTLCAVLVEPMQGAGGAIPGTTEFLQTLRDACTEHGVFLIFDEVISSRLSGQALQGLLGILPDMTTLGKYVGRLGLRRFWWQGGDHGPLRPFQTGRLRAQRHVQQQRSHVGGRCRGLRKNLHARKGRRLERLGRPLAGTAQRTGPGAGRAAAGDGPGVGAAHASPKRTHNRAQRLETS